MEKEKKSATVGGSLLVMGLIVAFMCGGMILFKGKLQVLIFFSWLLVLPYAMYLGYTFKDLEEGAYDMMRKVLQPGVIILGVGAMIGTWILSGTVPLLIYIGLDIITPKIFLLTTLLLCSIVSLCTGTSWGTIGTAGLAMVGIGAGLGIPAGMTAGAVICGAFFGDKMSPVSDSTNLAAAVTGTELMTHVKHMCYTTGPSYLICCVIFTVIGFKYGANDLDHESIATIMNGIAATFKLGFVPLLPAVLVITLLLLKRPAVSSIMLGAVAGALVAILYQDASIATTLNAMNSGYSGKSGMEFLDKLLNRGGIASMYGIMGLFIFALGLGGMLQTCGILTAILSIFANRIKSNRDLLFSAMIVSYISNCIGATISFASVMTGTLMAPMFRERGVKPENLSRIIEDCGTLSGPVIPWNTGSVYASGALGVSPFEFIPYCFLSFINPVISIIYAITGFSITTYSEGEMETTHNETITVAEAIRIAEKEA